jgi:hypothetical protein
VLAEDVPKITDWMQGWGTVAGAIASAGALIGTIVLLWHEIRVRREEKADSAQAQARLVVGTFVGGMRSSTDPDTGHLVGPLVGFRWRVSNYSGAPVFDVSGRVTYASNGLTYGSGGPIEVLDKPEVRESKVDPPVDWPDDSDLGDASLEIRFTDAKGLVWRRVDRRPPTRVLSGGTRSAGWTIWLGIALGAVGTVLGVIAVLIHR